MRRRILYVPRTILAARAPLSFGEAVLATLALVILAAAAYGSHVVQGGFYADDWANASVYDDAASPRYVSSVRYIHELLGARPVLALLLPLPHALLGLHTSAQLGMALVLGITTSSLFYVALRTLSMAPLHAGAIAALVLIFPWSDSIRLWATASLNSVAVCFFLLGFTLALRGLARRGRASVAMHGAAVGCYLLSILTYEVAAGAAVLAGFFYLGRAPVRRAVLLWIVDVAVVLGALGYSLVSGSGNRHVGSLGERIADIPVFLHQSLSLLARALVPLGSSNDVVKVIVLLVVAGVIVLASNRLRRSTADERLRQAAIVVAVSAIGLVAAYFMFLGSFLYPLDPGLGNRANVFAALPFCALVYGLIVLGSCLLFRDARTSAIVGLAAVALVGAGYIVRLRADQSSWRRAAVIQRQVLSVIDGKLARLPQGSTLLSFGAPAEAAPGVPVFSVGWDLLGAVRLRAADKTVATYPVFESVAVHCGRSRLTVSGPGDYGQATAAYGRLYFVDIRSGREQRVGDAESCQRALRAFPPGPRLAVSGARGS